MLSNVTHSNFNFECNKERGSIEQLYIELGFWPKLKHYESGRELAMSNPGKKLSTFEFLFSLLLWKEYKILLA